MTSVIGFGILLFVFELVALILGALAVWFTYGQNFDENNPNIVLLFFVVFAVCQFAFSYAVLGGIRIL